MSQWTHIAGIIRLDCIMHVPERAEIEEIFGEMPASEGECVFSVWENPRRNDVASRTISIFGDLRDFGEDEVPEIQKWWSQLHNKLDGKPMLIRQAVIEISVEYGDILILTEEDMEGWEHE